MPTLAALLIQLSLTATIVAGDPAPACRVELLPADASGAWASAASSLQRTLGTASAPDRDCREVVIHADPAHASVEVTTRDGRRGVRALGDAREVEPVVTALIVTVPDDVAVEREAPPPTTPARRHLLVMAAGGAKLTLPSTPESMVAAGAGVVQGPWELTLYGAWSPSIIGSSAAANAIYSSTSELQIGVARRRPFHSLTALLGVRAGAVRIAPNDNTDGAQSGNNVNLNSPAVAPTMSAFAGAAIPLFSFLRLRPELSVQWIPPLWSSPDVQLSLWSLGLSLGAESSLL
jgi:hypothetical protein